MATIAALATSPRNTNSTATTSPMPTSRLWTTLWVVTCTRSTRWLKTEIRIPGGIIPSRSISANFAATALAVGRDFSPLRISTIPSTTSGSVPRPTIPRRGWWPSTHWCWAAVSRGM